MGFMNAEPDDRQEFLVVASSRGRMTLTSVDGVARHFAKARVFLMEDKTVTAVTYASGGSHELVWMSFPVENSTWQPPFKLLTVKLASEVGGELVLDGAGCGCGMGSVGNAGPVDGPYRLTPVRDPEWHSVI